MAKRPVGSRSESELLFSIDQKLDRLIGISATSGRPLEQQIMILRGMGYDWHFIGTVVGMAPTAARMRFARRGRSRHA